MTLLHFKPIEWQMKGDSAMRGGKCLFFAAALALAPLPAAAEEGEDAAAAPPPLRVQAERMESRNGLLQAEGEVEARFDGYKLCAGRITYDQSSGLIQAVQDVRLVHSSGEITGSSASYRRGGDGGGEIRDFHTREEETGLRIKGEYAQWQASGLRARRAEITSCPRGSEDWHLSAGEAVTDEEDKTLHVRNVALHLAGVPLLYLPYGMFYYGKAPRSGFLPLRAQLGSGSGAGIAVPYYFLLAQNYDFTFTPEYRSQHGLQLAGEFRFLTAQSGGTLQVATALGDAGGRGRERLDYRYEQNGLLLRLAAENVSDSDYLRDYGADDETAVRTLPRMAVLRVRRGNFFGRVAAEHFKSLDGGLSAPHRAFPQVDAGGSGSSGGYDWQTSAQWADFRHNTRAGGRRLVWRGNVRTYRRWGGLALSPAVGVHAVRYTGAADVGFSVPYAKVEAEKNFANLLDLPHGRDQLRLRAAVVAAAANERQLNAPLFDTAVREQNAENLFEWNRFVGDDRASDSRFVAYGGSYRLFDGDAEQLFVAVAQRYHLRAARIALPQQDAPPPRGFGNILVNGHLQLHGRWRAAAAAEWSAAQARMERVYAEVHGAFSEKELLHLRYLKDDDDSLVLGGALPLGTALEVAAQTDYLLNEERFSRSWLALRLRDSCDCWNISFTVSDSVVNEHDSDTRFSIGMELHGLGGIGNDYSSLLRRLR